MSEKCRSFNIPIQSYSEEKLARLVAESRPVFVNVTADFCLICKMNERTAINREEVKAVFTNKGGVIVLIDDWTRGDTAIPQSLITRSGRRSRSCRTA